MFWDYTALWHDCCPASSHTWIWITVEKEFYKCCWSIDVKWITVCTFRLNRSFIIAWQCKNITSGDAKRLRDHAQDQRPRRPNIATFSKKDHWRRLWLFAKFFTCFGYWRCSTSTASLSILDFGPIFSPVNRLAKGSHKIVGSLQCVHERLRLRVKEERRGRDSQGVMSSSMYKPQEPDPVVDTKFRVFVTSFFSILTRYSKKLIVSNLTSMKHRGLYEIRDLYARGEIKVSV